MSLAVRHDGDGRTHETGDLKVRIAKLSEQIEAKSSQLTHAMQARDTMLIRTLMQQRKTLMDQRTTLRKDLDGK